MPAPRINRPFAEQGDTTVVPQVDPNGFINFTEGYTRSYEISIASGDTQAKAVERRGQNWLFNILTAGLQDFQLSSLPPFYSDMPNGYARNAQVSVGDPVGGYTVWRSLRNGVLTAPGANAADWERQQATGEFASRIPILYGGIAALNAADPTLGSILEGQNINFNNQRLAGAYFINLTVNANASTNGPRYPEGTLSSAERTQPGMLLNWQGRYGGTLATYQQYFDSFGRSFNRFYNGDSQSWTNWRVNPDVSDVQSGRFNFAQDTGAVNAVTVNPNPAIAVRQNGMLISFRVAATNTGATMINDGLGAVRLLSASASPLIGGEIIGTQVVLARYDAAHTAYIIVSTAGAWSVPTGSYIATQPNYAYDGRIVNSNWVNQNALMRRQVLPDTVDLNTVGGAANQSGIYFQNADSRAQASLNYPVQLLGYLHVYMMSDTSSGVVQVYYDRLGGVWSRGNLGGTWSPWLQSASVAYADSIIGNYNGASTITPTPGTPLAVPFGYAGRTAIITGVSASGVLVLPSLANAVLKSGRCFTFANYTNVPQTIQTTGAELIWYGAQNNPTTGSSVLLNPGENIAITWFSNTMWVLSGGTGSIKYQPKGSTRTGEVAWIAYDSALPDGAMDATGGAISRTAYADLFAKLGTRYGAGNGTTTYNLPDLRGRFIRGWDNGRGLDPARVLGSNQDQQNQAHNHTGNTDAAGNHQHDGNTGVNGDHNHALDYRTPQESGFPYQSGFLNAAFNIGAPVQPYTGYGGNHQHYFITNYGGNHAHSFTTSTSGGESRPVNIALRPIIFF